MSFYEKLRENLKEKIPEKLLEKLPHSYSMIGKVIILKLPPELLPWKNKIGESILEILPGKTVCILKGIKGEIRRPEIEVIAGNGTETFHKEHKCIYKIDVAKFMFSKGNKFEKIRVVKQIKPGEVVIDMFAGIGYFTIPIAKLTEAERVYAMDINPEAIEYLKENVKLNKVEKKVRIFCGDCRKVCKTLREKADRVLMGYIFNSKNFFPSALSISKNGTIIHYHFLAKCPKNEIEELEKISKNFGKSIKLLWIKKVKSYSPRIWHWVADLMIRNK